MPAEIWITNVDYHNGAISRVCARLKPIPNQLSHTRSYTRAEILGMLRATMPNTTRTNVIYTATTKDGGRTYARGARVIETADGNFITTEGNATTKDNLGNLPPCDC